MKKTIISSIITVLLIFTTRLYSQDHTKGDHKPPSDIKMVVFVIDIDNIDSANQRFTANVFVRCRWTDPTLKHPGPNKIIRPLKDVWHPRIQFINQQKIFHTRAPEVEISPGGEAVYCIRVWGYFSQPLNLRHFPFDKQNFNIKLVASGYKPDELNLVPDPDMESFIADKLSLADWSILEYKGKTTPYEPLPGVKVSGFLFSFTAKRHSNYYLLKVILPLLLIVGMSWIVFWIPPKQAATQISVSVTSMLTLIAYRFAVDSQIPNISYLTRLDYFILGSTILVFLTLLQVVITSIMATNDQLKIALLIDMHSRWGFPLIFIIIFVHSLFM